MSSREVDTIRFGVRSGDFRWSGTWKLWAKRADVYLVMRMMGRLIKLSLHKSGVWRLAWTGPSGVVSHKSGDRAEMKWKRPAEFAFGWTQGPTVMVANVGQSAPFPIEPDEEPHPVYWVEPPQIGHKVGFTVLFSSPSIPVDSRPSVLRAGDVIAGRIPLVTGESVWLSTRVAPLDAGEQLHIERFYREIRIHPARGQGPDDILGATLVEVIEGPTPLIVDMTMQKTNVAEAPSAPSDVSQETIDASA